MLNKIRGRLFMTSATLGGGVNQILTFIDCGGGKAGQSESDILLTHAEKRGGDA